VRLEKLIPAFVRFVEPDAVHPGSLLVLGQVFESFVFALLAITELLILASHDVAKHQVIRQPAILVATVVATIFDTHLGVVLVATLFLGKRRVVPPTRESCAGQVIVQVAALGHVVKSAIQIFGITRRFQVIEPVRARCL